jgi:hypothetical protein
MRASLDSKIKEFAVVELVASGTDMMLVNQSFGE